MGKELLQLLQEKSNTFSKGRQLLANYITESYDKAAFMTAAKIGKVVGVSESTVVRFACELGFDGYPGLQKAMQELVSDRMSSGDKMVISSDDSDRVFRAEIENIRQTAVLLDKDAFSNVVKSILNCENIYVIGGKMSSFLAEYFGSSLQLLFRGVHIITDCDAGNMLEKLLYVSSKDVVVGINFPQYSTATEKAVEYCHTTGAKVFGFTDTMLSPMAKYCDHVLLAKCDKISFPNSLAAPFSLMNALLSALVADREDVVNEKMRVLNNIYDAYNVSEK